MWILYGWVAAEGLLHFKNVFFFLPLWAAAASILVVLQAVLAVDSSCQFSFFFSVECVQKMMY